MRNRYHRIFSPCGDFPAVSGNRLVLSESTFFIKFKEIWQLLRWELPNIVLHGSLHKEIWKTDSRHILDLPPPMRKLWERMHMFTMRGLIHMSPYTVCEHERKKNGEGQESSEWKKVLHRTKQTNDDWPRSQTYFSTHVSTSNIKFLDFIRTTNV